MFFEKVEEIFSIAKKNGCAVFVVPKKTMVEDNGAIVLEPREKSVITIEQVREVIGRINNKQTSEQFIVIRPAERMSEEAANAFLKNLEEPKERVHFILITDSPSLILATILSRSAIYFLRENSAVSEGIEADEKIKELAKRLMVAKPGDLVGLAEEITKKKDGVRAYALEILGVAIEMLYKSYFITGKEGFLNKLPKFLETYESIQKNGHIKLHLVADLC